MKKPKIQKREYYEYHQCISFIEEKYKINTSDYENSFLQFNEWVKEKGEEETTCHPGCTDKQLKAHQEQFARFQADIDSGKVIERPYLNFTHWMSDVYGDLREEFELNKTVFKGAPQFVQHIGKLLLKEFGKGPYLAE